MIKFVDGMEGAMDGYAVAAFDVSGNVVGSKWYETAGLCVNSANGSLPWLRSSKIYIVKQGNLKKTIGVLVHELAHAAAWILHLPACVDRALDGEPR